MLKPYVCDCTPGTAQNCSSDDHGDEPVSALAASKQAATTAVERASAEARLESESGEPSLRTLERNAAKDPLELVSVADDEAGVDVSDVSRAEQLQETYGVALDENAATFTGNFSPKPGSELLVVRPGRDLAVYGTDSRIAKLDLGGEPAASAFADLGLPQEKTTPQSVRLIQDGTLQVLMHWREEAEQGTFAYKVGVFKVIGPFVARVFERTLAVSEAEDGRLRRRGTYEFLRGDSHRFIRWIPADESGELLTDQAVLLQWNRWEGLYRVPKPAPTAPKHNKMRSQSAPDARDAELARR